MDRFAPRELRLLHAGRMLAKWGLVVGGTIGGLTVVGVAGVRAVVPLLLLVVLPLLGAVVAMFVIIHGRNTLPSLRDLAMAMAALLTNGVLLLDAELYLACVTVVLAGLITAVSVRITVRRRGPAF
ncbi:hypothetical protein [Nakamurella leprariae]|uniref:Uncharacterized protein n=1 Tax=Nakamurella leprariae TaxID=2803911 RepID=A0A938YFP6_9ACTN|nr:hypothetical protein [Nakamurella leprariae]MBM9466968.1 hypothetical protein [Nakamurella leprariae]